MLKWIIYSERGEGQGVYTAQHSRDGEDEKEEEQDRSSAFPLLTLMPLITGHTISAKYLGCVPIKPWAFWDTFFLFDAA